MRAQRNHADPTTGPGGTPIMMQQDAWRRQAELTARTLGLPGAPVFDLNTTEPTWFAPIELPPVSAAFDQPPGAEAPSDGPADFTGNTATPPPESESLDFNFDLNGGFVGSDMTAAPLTQAILSGDLVTAINQLYYTTTGAPNVAPANTPSPANRVAAIGVNGTIQTGGSVTLRDASQEGGAWTDVPGVTADPATGKYFIIDSRAGTAQRILSGSINTPGALTQIGSYAASTFRVLDITIDQPNQTLYYTLLPTGAGSAAGSIGVWKMREDGSNLTQVIGGYTASTAANTPRALALDLPNNLVFFSEGAALTGTSRILAGNVLSGSKSAALISHNTGTVITDILVHGSTLFYSTANGGTVSGNNIFSAPIVYSGSGASKTATLGTATTLYAGANAGNPLSIAIDPVSGRLYSAGITTIGATGTVAINVGTITGGGAMQSLFTQSNGTSGVIGGGLFFQSTPTVAATGTVTFVQAGSSATLAAGANVVSPSGFTLKSATVAITGGNFTNDGDTLTAVTSGTSITAVFSGDTLTLSGIDTAANYKQVLSSVTYKSTATDPGNGGANKSRTITWTVSDGVINSTSPTTTVNIHGLPTIVAGGTVSFSGGGSPVTLASGLTVTDPYSTTIAAATVSIAGFFAGDTLNFINQGGVVGNYVTNSGTLSLTGVASLATYQTALRSITYSYNPGNGDPTNGGSKTGRVINWSVNDGVTTSTNVTSALTIIRNPPTITTSGTVTYGIGHPPAELDPALTVVAPNSLGLLHGATVTISGGAFVGESDVLTANTLGNITFNFNTTSNVATLSGADTVANYQSVLRSIKISASGDPSNGGANKTRSFAWTVNDGVANSATATSFADAVPCFVEDTMILTPAGEVAVQALRAGDLVLTRTGQQRPIRWIGTRRLDLARHPEPNRVRPVRIRADAMAPGVPRRDLSLSPDHAVWLDGVLVPAHLLRNGASITRDETIALVTYYHVELETHDVLVADGMPAESYLDTGNRDLFANGGGATRLHPDMLDSDQAQQQRVARSCAPFATAPDQAEPLWRQLAERARRLGYQAPAAANRIDPDPHLLVDGRRVDALLREAGRHIFALPGGAERITLASASAIPSDARPWIDDHRRLGLMVSRLVLRGPDGHDTPIPLDHPALAEGWWAPEWHASSVLRRWTDGGATITLERAGGRLLEVVVAETAAARPAALGPRVLAA